MKKELTNEEIAKVFAMYWNGIYLRHTESILKSSTVFNVKSGLHIIQKSGVEDRRLKLFNLTNISNIDAVEIALLCVQDEVYKNKKDWKLARVDDRFMTVTNKNGITVIIHYDNKLIEPVWSDTLRPLPTVHETVPMAFQYLLLKNYSVPIFFAPNHWANGKTAIELGIAIDATTIKAEI